MKDCAYYEELISRLIDRELTAEEGEELRAHASECENCRAVYTAFSALSGMLSDDLVEPPAELGETVMSAIRRSEMKKLNQSAKKRTRRILSLAACAVLVIGIGALTVPRLLSKGSPASGSAAPKAVYSSMAAAETSLPDDSDTMLAEEAPAEDYRAYTDVSESFAAPAVETTKSENEMISEALERAEEPETVAEIVDVTGQGRGKNIAALLVGTQGELPSGQTPDRRFLLRFDVDGVSSQVLISVYGERVFFISLSGEESDMVQSDYSWSSLRARIYN